MTIDGNASLRSLAPARPIAVLIAAIGMLVVAICTAVRFLGWALPGLQDGQHVAATVIVYAGTTAMFTFVPLLAAWGAWKARRSAPVLITIVAAAVIPQIIGWGDVYGVVAAAASLAAVVAIWTPQSREYGTASREFASRGTSIG